MVDVMQCSRYAALVGAIVWLGWSVVTATFPLEASWATALLLLAAWVLIPLCLGVLFKSVPPSDLDWSGRIAMHLYLPAACALGVSCSLPVGIGAAISALPWLGFTGLVAWTGGCQLYRRGLIPLSALCVDAGLVFLAVGGGWTLLSRFGARPLAFSPEIVELTAVHFHYAGFVLPILTGLSARAIGGVVASIAAVGVMAGVPLVAVGITATQLGFGLLLEGVAAVITAFAGLLTAGLQWRLASRPEQPAPARWLWALSAVALVVGMSLAALYGLRAYWPMPWLNIPWMRAVHGSVNALGFSLAGIVAWYFASREHARWQISASESLVQGEKV